MCFFTLLSTTYIRASTSDITTLSVCSSNIIFQEESYLDHSAWKMTVVAVIHFEPNVALYVCTQGRIKLFGALRQ